MRSFDHIVGQIRDAIASGGIAPGERLPSERDLGVAFGVSRTTLREALRALEAQGVIEIRTGSRGGAFVAEPSSELVAAALGALLRFRSATARELAEFRVPFEAENAGLGRAPRRSGGARRARAHRRRRGARAPTTRACPGPRWPRSRCASTMRLRAQPATRCARRS